MNPLQDWNITNIHRGKGNRRHIIYAELCDNKNELVISATLDYIKERIRDLIPIIKEIQ